MPLVAPYRFFRAFGPRLAALVIALLLLARPGSARAHAAGWPSEGCGGCHSGGKTPTVSITPDLQLVNPGQMVNLTVSISTINGNAAGFYLTASAGKLSIVETGTRLLGNGVTQNGKRTGSGSAITFKVGWTAPATPGGVDFNAWGNSVNNDNNSGGDAAATAFLSFAYGCPGTKYYHDYDGDGVGASGYGYTIACSVPSYYSASGDDCNDSEPANFPGNKEICDGKDNDCNSQVDEGLAIGTYCVDADADGHGAIGKTTISGCAPKKGYGACDNDCNDADAAVFAGNPEVCDGKDNDCNGQIDELLPVATYCPDVDGDNHGVLGGATISGCIKPAGHGKCDGDCNDGDKTVYPGARELCDGKDNNCNNKIDEDAKLICGVGWCAAEASSCSSMCTPGAPRREECNDFDDDCDGLIDNGTDRELCGAPGLLCQAGYCVPDGLSGEGGAGGEAGAPSQAGGSGAGDAGGGLASGGEPMVEEPSEPDAGVIPPFHDDTLPQPPRSCGIGLSRAHSPLALLGVLLTLGLVLRRARRR